MTRWNHGHSLATGGLLTLALLHGHLLWTLTAVFALGFALGRGWDLLARLLRRLGQRAQGWPVIEGRVRRW